MRLDDCKIFFSKKAQEDHENSCCKIPNDALQLAHRQGLWDKKLDLVHLRKIRLSAVFLDDQLYNRHSKIRYTDYTDSTLFTMFAAKCRTHK